MNEKKPEKKESIVKIVGLPTLAAGAGSLIGGVGGGALTRSLLDTPGVSSRLAKMSPERRAEVLKHLQSLGAGAAGAASAVGSYALSEYIRDRMDRRREIEEKSRK